MNRFPLVSALLSALLLAGGAQAHQVWLEQTDQAATLYFGEFGDNLRETSPGLLDKFAQPSATLLTANGEKPLKLDRTANAFLLSGRAAQGESIVAEEANYPVIENKKGDVVTRMIWTPAARYVGTLSAHAPKLTLDLVPTGKAGEFKVFYQGKPLPKAKVGAVVQSGWMKEAYSNEQGIVQFSLPWKGLYVLEVHHTDKTAGERRGKPYDTASYVTTLSLVQADGVDPLPAGPAATPNQ